MTALDTATVPLAYARVTLLARHWIVVQCRLLARLPLPWVLEQEAVALTAAERTGSGPVQALLLVEMLGAWEVGMRLRGAGEKARGP